MKFVHGICANAVPYSWEKINRQLPVLSRKQLRMRI